MKKIMRLLLVITMLVVSSISLYAQAIPPDSLYFGQTPPGDTPVIFAPGIVSLPNRKEPLITFAPDGMSAYFYIEFYPNPGTPYVMFSEYKNGAWTKPASPSFAMRRMTAEPFFALGGKRIYLNSTNALNQVGIVDLSYVEKNDSVWSQPISLGNPPNLPEDQYHSCIVADTSIYLSSSGGNICYSQYKNGMYHQRVTLPYPINSANTTQTWGDPFVSPDESYLILKSTRNGGYGGNDIYISYRKADKSWTNPKNLGSKINTSSDETSGDITPDGKYMTFGRNGDLYWVSTSFIDSLKHTNFAPYLKNLIPSQTDTVGHSFNFTIPDSTFIDDDENDTLTFTAKLNNGNPLPSWLSFNPGTRTFSGIPTTAISKAFPLKVTVTVKDTANASASSTFGIAIDANPVGVEEDKNQLPKSINLNQNYPNPFNPTTTIEFAIPKSGKYKLSLYNTLGELVREISNKEYEAGNYKETFNATGLTSGMYIYRLTGNDANIVRKMVLLR